MYNTTPSTKHQLPKKKYTPNTEIIYNKTIYSMHQSITIQNINTNKKHTFIDQYKSPTQQIYHLPYYIVEL